MSLDYDELVKLGMPPTLATSVIENGSYALGLRDGTVVHFEEADYFANCKDWIHLRTIESETKETPHYDEGMTVRIADIVWVADTE